MVKKEKAWTVADRTLLDIVAHDEVKLLTASLEDNKDEVIDFRDKFGVSALHTAACYNHLNLAKILIDAGVDVNATSDVAITPLHIAAELGHYEFVTLLLDAGAAPAPLNDQFQTPLMLARKNKFSRIVVLLEPLVQPLLEKSPNALAAAAAGDVLYLVSLIDRSKLQYGEVFTSPSELGDVNDSGDTILTIIFKQAGGGSSSSNDQEQELTEGHSRCLDLILKEKLVNVNQANSSKLTALMMATKASLFATAKKLLQFGADPTAQFDEADEATTARSLTQDEEFQLFLYAAEKKFTFETQLELRNTIPFDGRPAYIVQMKQFRREMRAADVELKEFLEKKNAPPAEQEETNAADTNEEAAPRPGSGSARPNSGSAKLSRPASTGGRPGSAAASNQ